MSKMKIGKWSISFFAVIGFVGYCSPENVSADEYYEPGEIITIDESMIENSSGNEESVEYYELGEIICIDLSMIEGSPFYCLPTLPTFTYPSGSRVQGKMKLLEITDSQIGPTYKDSYNYW